jgi:hypothetical protein
VSIPARTFRFRIFRYLSHVSEDVVEEDCAAEVGGGAGDDDVEVEENDARREALKVEELGAKGFWCPNRPIELLAACIEAV